MAGPAPALHLLALPRPGQRDRQGQASVLANAPFRQPGGVAVAAAAVTVGRTDTALGAFYRRLSARVGKAVTATARKIAVLFYNALRHGMDYADPGASYYEERYQRVLANPQRRASRWAESSNSSRYRPAPSGCRENFEARSLVARKPTSSKNGHEGLLRRSSWRVSRPIR